MELGVGHRGAHLVRVTVLAVVGLVVALCPPSAGEQSVGRALGSPTGTSTGASTGVSVTGGS